MSSLTEIVVGRKPEAVGQVAVTLAIDAINRQLTMPIDMAKIVEQAERKLNHE